MHQPRGRDSSVHGRSELWFAARVSTFRMDTNKKELSLSEKAKELKLQSACLLGKPEEKGQNARGSVDANLSEGDIISCLFRDES